jgi:hypothetical protein
MNEHRDLVVIDVVGANALLPTLLFSSDIIDYESLG